MRERERLGQNEGDLTGLIITDSSKYKYVYLALIQECRHGNIFNLILFLSMDLLLSV